MYSITTAILKKIGFRTQAQKDEKNEKNEKIPSLTLRNSVAQLRLRLTPKKTLITNSK